MLKSLFFLLFGIPLMIAAQFVDSTKENYKAYYYEEGNISSEGTLRNGKPDNYWITYFPNGLRKSEGNRKNFLLDSTWLFYKENGNIQYKINYLENKKHGVYQHFDENCLLVKEEFFKQDVINGVSKTFYPDSAQILVKKSVPYEDGRREGVGYEYAKDGRITAIVTYDKNFIISNEQINGTDKNGLKQGVWKEYFSNERLKTEKRYKDDKLNGYVKQYNSQGKLESATLYINGEEQSGENNIADFDVNTIYYPDGTPKSTSVYNKAGKRDGVSTYYDKDGSISNTEIYKNGYLLRKGIIDANGFYQGNWEEYYLNGKLKSKGAYKDGKKYGKWEYYFTTGKVEQKGSYDANGRFTGEWNWYYENGNLLRKEEFRKGIEDGELAEYTLEGKLITKGEYFDGEKEGEWFYELNDHQEKGKYRYGERNGYWEHRFPEGKVSFEGSYVDGAPQGKHKYYSEDGYLIKEENYSFGQKDGKWKWYDAFGNETTTITYDEDQEVRIDGQKIK
jgi:antitoxin component YwqK of YwqJK toxin-antitoxin module